MTRPADPRPGRGLKKPAGALHVATREVVSVLNQLSKAALVDIVAQAVAIDTGEGDTPPSVADVLAYVEPVLVVRGDRMPRVEPTR